MPSNLFSARDNFAALLRFFSPPTVPPSSTHLPTFHIPLFRFPFAGLACPRGARLGNLPPTALLSRSRSGRKKHIRIESLLNKRESGCAGWKEIGKSGRTPPRVYAGGGSFSIRLIGTPPPSCRTPLLFPIFFR